MTPLPLMSSQEASWHEHLAGIRAAEAAREEGSNPAAVAAFASATAGPVTLAGLTLRPASQGTLWTLQRVARAFDAWAAAHALPHATDPDEPGTRELIELGLATLVFCDARHVWRELDAGRQDALIAAAEEMMWSLPIPEQIALQAHFRSQMDAINALSGDSGDAGEDTPEKKPHPPQASPLPVMQIPPQAQALPPSSGWQQSIASPLRQPYGKPLWP